MQAGGPEPTSARSGGYREQQAESDGQEQRSCPSPFLLRERSLPSEASVASGDLGEGGRLCGECRCCHLRSTDRRYHATPTSRTARPQTARPRTPRRRQVGPESGRRGRPQRRYRSPSASEGEARREGARSGRRSARPASAAHSRHRVGDAARRGARCLPGAARCRQGGRYPSRRAHRQDARQFTYGGA